jgi:hypothetical protein
MILLVLIRPFLLRELRGGIAASLQKAHHKPGAQARKKLLAITPDGRAISFSRRAELSLKRF